MNHRLSHFVSATLCGAALFSGVPALAQSTAVPPPRPPANTRPYSLDHPSYILPATPNAAIPAPILPNPASPGQPALLPGTEQDLLLRDQDRFRRNAEADDRRRAQRQAGASAFVTDYGKYGLSPPPPGTMWVREGQDAVLVDQKTGAVTLRRSGVFASSP